MYILFLALVSLHAFAWSAKQEGIWDTHAHQWIGLQELATRTHAGDILVFGEQHATVDTATDPSVIIHHDNQVRLLEALHAGGANVSVGMEFLTFTAQTAVDQFRSGALSEADFLKAAGWAMGNPFEFYRRQILFAGGGRTLALNTPNQVADDVARLGPGALPLGDRALLPPIWEQGNADYFARFKNAIGGHGTPDELQNYFWAQSLWDDTMAWKAQDAPQDILMIIVGAFHVEFGGGLPFELTKLYHRPVKTVLQIETADWDPATLSAAVAPDALYGEHADYLWVHSGAQQP